MDKKEALRVMKEIAKPLGYQTRRSYFWHHLDDVTVMIVIERARWTEGFDVITGLLPKKHFPDESKPPHSGHWGFSFDPKLIPNCPYKAFFDRFHGDEGAEMPAQELIEPMKWFFDWSMCFWPDVEAARASVLDNSSFFAARRKIWIKDWANGELKDLAEYQG